MHLHKQHLPDVLIEIDETPAVGMQFFRQLLPYYEGRVWRLGEINPCSRSRQDAVMLNTSEMPVKQ